MSDKGHAARLVLYPCYDPTTGRYRSFPCSQCKAVGCVFGKKPTRIRPALGTGYRYCQGCGTPFRARTRAIWCSEACRKPGVLARQRDYDRSRRAR